MAAFCVIEHLDVIKHITTSILPRGVDLPLDPFPFQKLEKELGEKASELLSKISGDGYFANKKANDAEVPDTQDPALLARADNATQFVNGTGKKPFAGMSSDQLSLIIYDETGSFTTNERRADSVSD